MTTPPALEDTGMRCLLFAVLTGLCLRAQPVDFNRDVRPILSDKCFSCHGPDAPAKNIRLRLDREESALADLGRYRAIVPGNPAASELYRRITAQHPARRMPPVHSGRTLNAAEIDILRRWIEQGAQWQKHWAFIPPARPVVPQVKRPDWVRNPIDAFILARLEREGLQPSPEAPPATLLRRVTLDLTGLPPTPAEVDAFLADRSPDAYERVVDRLLSSPRFGEKMAARWLDAARYADTNGYQTDAERLMWRWRDWVIDAFNRNLPFNQFVIEQLAGDLLPNPTLEQKIATGFNRNHRANSEGGIVPEEFLVEYAVDRVETTFTVFQGLTIGCARCHNHKYDPITQKEFYQVLAYFNNIPEMGRVYKVGNSPPLIAAPTPEQQQELARLEERLKAAERAFRAGFEASAFERWVQKEARRVLQPWFPRFGLRYHWSFDDQSAAGRAGRALALDGSAPHVLGNHAAFGYFSRFSLSAWIFPEKETGAILTRAEDTAEPQGYGVWLASGKLAATFVQRWLDDAIRVESTERIPLRQWTHVAVSYDGSRTAAGVALYINGRRAEVNVLLDALNQDFVTKEPLRAGGGGGPEQRFQGRLDEIRIYDRVLAPEEVAVIALETPVSEAAAAAQRSAAQQNQLRWAYAEDFGPPVVRQRWAALREARLALEKFRDSIPTVMIMQEREAPKDTYVLIRGQYDKPGEKVTRGVPAALPPLPPGAPNNRLGFAQWLVSPENPLTARVTVNRFWQMLFGVGIVKTVEDFGSQGEWPTHPELLDWLATEFMQNGWDVKKLLRLIVTSSTYRQSSRVTPELLQRDPENRLLARGPRFRMPAEMIRDQALSASGLLVEKVGGPSVKPYQPPGLWKEITGGPDYEPDKGEGLWRRSLYTFWKRTVAPPLMLNFDSAMRETCTVREVRTNTPLQALNLMNDVTFVEAARVLAERVMKERQDPAARLELAWRSVLVRPPEKKERDLLLQNFYGQLDYYQTQPQLALELVTQGTRPRDASLDVAQLAAYTAMASMILNLDEAITKE